MGCQMMKQSVLAGPQHSQLEERPLPEIGPQDVLVRVRACGVCASELHGWHGDSGAYPRKFGHEVAGEIVEVGREVVDLQPGMPATGLFQGGFAEFACAPQARVTPIPPGISYDTALGEPLSCILSAARRTHVEYADRVAIIGLGFMGLLMLQAVRLKAPARLIAVDPRPEALEKARHFGADETLTPEQVGDELKLTRWGDLGQGQGVDTAIEASGTQAGLTLAGQMVREHGMLSIVGYHQGGLRQVDMELWNWKALDVLNAHERRADYQMDCMRRGLALLAAGKLDTVSLVTHRLGLEQVDDAFRALSTKPAGFIKAVILLD
jgi:threonine dehydrogenase-like Zn-dependent dehydrogenase